MPAPAAYQPGPYPPPPPTRHAVPTYPPAFLQSAPIRPVPAAQHTFLPPSMPQMSTIPPPPQTNSVQPEQVPKLERPPGLSRFAELYVPMWLRRVNADPPVAVIPRSAAEAFTVRPLHVVCVHSLFAHVVVVRRLITVFCTTRSTLLNSCITSTRSNAGIAFGSRT